MEEKVNAKYKDRVFRLLFGTEQYKQNTLDLYNAVNGSDYHNIDDLEFNTIDDAIYMKMKNDISFLFSNEINLYEHQGSFNPNMPLRGFMYLAKLFDKMVKANHYNVYGETLIKLPTPRYIVFYNGAKDQPDEKIFKLSDSFDDEGCAEMTAIAYNINYGHNKKLLDGCLALQGYSILVNQIRCNQKTMDTEEAVNTAVSYCINQGILKEVLLAHKAEVIDMCITEYNEEETMQMFKAEGRAEGRAEGKAEGMDNLSKLINHLAKQGLTEEILKVTSDETYRDQMLRSLNLI